MTDWYRDLDETSQALLDQALDRLEQARQEDLPGLIKGTSGGREIRKLQVGGKIRLRPLLCTGPQDKVRELTFLMPAFERNWKFDPADAVEQAETRRRALLEDRSRRRIYERA
jgi:hypothetical protein